MLLAWLVISCDPPKSSDDQSRGETRQFIAADLPRSEDTHFGSTFKPDYYRTHFVTFSLRRGIAPAGNYRIGAKVASQAAPTVTELTSATAALTLKLSTTDKNIYLPFHIAGTYFDTGATQNLAAMELTLLTPAITYGIYVTLSDGSGQVEKVLEITTDAAPTGVTDIMYGWPRGRVDYSINTGAPFVLAGYSLWGNGVNWLQGPTQVATCPSPVLCSPSVDYTAYVSGSKFILVQDAYDTATDVNYVMRDNGDSLRKITTGQFVPD